MGTIPQAPDRHTHTCTLAKPRGELDSHPYQTITRYLVPTPRQTGINEGRVGSWDLRLLSAHEPPPSLPHSTVSMETEFPLLPSSNKGPPPLLAGMVSEEA